MMTMPCSSVLLCVNLEKVLMSDHFLLVQALHGIAFASNRRLLWHKLTGQTAMA